MDPIGATEQDKWEINFWSGLVMDPIGATEQDKWEINFWSRLVTTNHHDKLPS